MGDCVLWQGVRYPSGYGHLGNWRHGTRQAHRAAYIDAYGGIPEGFHVHHKCEAKACVNPDHLEAVSPKAHRHLHLKDECKRGHLRRQPGACPACERDRMRERARRERSDPVKRERYNAYMRAYRQRIKDAHA